MASMGFSYAQIHVRQEKIRQRINQQEAAKKTTVKSIGEGDKIKKKNCDSWTAAGRVHPCASSTAAAAATARPVPER
ncbi:hypothetical protein CFC21_005470 [Triticum aestivum]|uniref:Uncharacterized protein n=3 Tax=Triticum TaxID=4564 RepID=A0A9R0V2J8_TRITD|nr:hypothetical protein CFC21_005470 [Triticum aestivum]VAH13555.1 unnamed protein product [Triticum turgidum subsp. durum]